VFFVSICCCQSAYSSPSQEWSLHRGFPFTKPGCLHTQGGERERERERVERERERELRERERKRKRERERVETSLPHLAAFGLPTPETRPCCGN